MSPASYLGDTWFYTTCWQGQHMKIQCLWFAAGGLRHPVRGARHLLLWLGSIFPHEFNMCRFTLSAATSQESERFMTEVTLTRSRPVVIYPICEVQKISVTTALTSWTTNTIEHSLNLQDTNFSYGFILLVRLVLYYTTMTAVSFNVFVTTACYV